MSKLQIFYAEGGRYVSDEYSRASVGDIAFGGELNQTTLFGSQQIYTEPHPFMYVSDTVSDANGVLESQTSVNIERQNINGLTMIFDPAGGTHPKEVNVVLMSQTTPNFTNRIESESYSMDMSGKISADGILRGYRIDPETGEFVQDAGYMVTGVMLMSGSPLDVIYTSGIDWTDGDQTKIGVCAYKQRWSGVRTIPVFSDFLSISELLENGNNMNKIEIGEDGNAVLHVGYALLGNYFAFSMPISDTMPIATINEPITYGEAQTAQPTTYVGASIVSRVDSPLCTLDITANDVTSIAVGMTDINAPYVHHKLTTMYSGAMTEYSEDKIISCDIIEQMDVLSETMPTNTCDIVMIEPDGIRYNPSVRQRLEVYRDGDLRGVFFIDNVKKTGTNRYTISSHGITGELERYTFYGDVYKNKDAERLIAEIFEAAGIYHIMERVPSVHKISGYLPITDCKTALRTVLFACGMTLDVSRTPHPRVRYINVTYPTTEMEITDTLVGESVTEESPVARIEVKTRVYINPDDDPDYPAPSTQYCSHKEYGKGYKPVIIIPNQPSLVSRTASINAVMPGSTANRILWDATRYYTYTDGQGGTYNSNDWAVQLWAWAVRESTASAYMQDAVGAVIQYDNTMIASGYGADIAERCLRWYQRGQTLDVEIVADIKLGQNIAVEISNGVVFTGTVTQIRYSPVGTRMMQEVVLHGTDHGSYARRL